MSVPVAERIPVRNGANVSGARTSPPGIRGNEPRDERSECKPGRAQPVRNEASGVVLKNASAASLL